MKNTIILRVYKNSLTGQKLISIPKSSPIITGDFVFVSKVDINEQIKKEVIGDETGD